MTLKEVAKRVDLDEGHLSRAERGEASAGPTMVAGYGALFSARELLDHLWAADRTEEQARKRRQFGRQPSGVVGALDVTPSGDCSVAGDAVEWIRAVNPPNDCHVLPGEEFLQGWLVRNSGVVPWRDRMLTRTSPPRGPEAAWSPSQVAIPDAEPGDEVLYQIPLRGAEVPGTIRVHFKQTDSAGRMYFPEVSWGVSVTVVTLPRSATDGRG